MSNVAETTTGTLSDYEEELRKYADWCNALIKKYNEKYARVWSPGGFDETETDMINSKLRAINEMAKRLNLSTEVQADLFKKHYVPSWDGLCFYSC